MVFYNQQLMQRTLCKGVKGKSLNEYTQEDIALIMIYVFSKLFGVTIGKILVGNDQYLLIMELIV